MRNYNTEFEGFDINIELENGIYSGNAYHAESDTNLYNDNSSSEDGLQLFEDIKEECSTINTTLESFRKLYPFSDEKIKEYAKAIYDDKMLASWYMNDPSLIPSVFMPIMLGALPHNIILKLMNISHVAGKINGSIGRAINGYPIVDNVIFIIINDDAERIHEHLKKIEKVIEGL